MNFFASTVVALLAWATTACAKDIVLDGNLTGRTFQGLGAVSAGASSRLLIDYPEPQRSEILDYLFKPNYGAALQHLKVEIGGGINSTDGTEPTHQRTRTDTNYFRGYEWWLMEQARARNPQIQLDCLAWGAPGWIGGGNYYSKDMVNYVVNFLNGAKKFHHLDINFTGTHNESGVQSDWIKSLRAGLDANGLGRVKLVAADEWNASWTIVDKMLIDPALSNAVYAVGVHYPSGAGYTSSAAAKTLGQPLWGSEEGIGGGTWTNAQNLAKIFNRNYIIGKITADEIWSPVSAYYDVLPCAGSGLMRANSPWSGHYVVSPAIGQ
jgi:galactosylceramidase